MYDTDTTTFHATTLKAKHFSKQQTLQLLIGDIKNTVQWHCTCIVHTTCTNTKLTTCTQEHKAILYKHP